MNIQDANVFKIHQYNKINDLSNKTLLNFTFAVMYFTKCNKNVNLINVNPVWPASWSSSNAFVSGARGLRFRSRTGLIGHGVVNGYIPLRHFFERRCVARAPTPYTLRHITASITKDLTCFDLIPVWSRKTGQCEKFCKKTKKSKKNRTKRNRIKC